jgi:hypothetical protein
MQLQQKGWLRLATDVQRLTNAVPRAKWVRPNERPDWAELRRCVIRALRQKGATESQAQEAVDRFAKDGL